jgi:hypothetical protein
MCGLGERVQQMTATATSVGAGIATRLETDRAGVAVLDFDECAANSATRVEANESEFAKAQSMYLDGGMRGY